MRASLSSAACRLVVWSFPWLANCSAGCGSRETRLEVVRQIYDHTDHDIAVDWVADIGRDFPDDETPAE